MRGEVRSEKLCCSIDVTLRYFGDDEVDPLWGGDVPCRELLQVFYAMMTCMFSCQLCLRGEGTEELANKVYSLVVGELLFGWMEGLLSLGRGVVVEEGAYCGRSRGTRDRKCIEGHHCVEEEEQGGDEFRLNRVAVSLVSIPTLCEWSGSRLRSARSDAIPPKTLQNTVICSLLHPLPYLHLFSINLFHFESDVVPATQRRNSRRSSLPFTSVHTTVPDPFFLAQDSLKREI